MSMIKRVLRNLPVGTLFGVVVFSLPAAGLRYTEFHSTALCSPTRAALITGRNHHSVGFGVIGELSTGYPGYDSIVGPESATIGTIHARSERGRTRQAVFRLLRTRRHALAASADQGMDR
jgi:Sulfatase